VLVHTHLTLPYLKYLIITRKRIYISKFAEVQTGQAALKLLTISYQLF